MTDRRVRALAQEGRIEGVRAEGGWKLFRYSIHSYRDARREREGPQSVPGTSENVREWIERANSLQRELGPLEGRLELTERAESTLREDLQRERSERREAQEEARRLREELEAHSKHDQSSAAPSALRGAWEEGAKEIARRLVVGIAGVVVFIPSALTAVISYFNNATTLAVLTGLLAFFATVTGLVGIYFGIKAASDASERSRSRAAEANAAVRQAAQEAEEMPREGGEVGVPYRLETLRENSRRPAQPRSWWRRMFGG